MDTNGNNLYILDNGNWGETVESVIDLDNETRGAEEVETNVATMLPTAAAPDFPAAVGWGLIGIYAAIMLDFVLFFTASRMAALMVGVSIVYVIVYLATPVAFMRIERHATGRRDRISFADFMRQGVETWTGHLGGGEAIAQIFTIPAVLAVALFAIGIAWQAAR